MFGFERIGRLLLLSGPLEPSRERATERCDLLHGYIGLCDELRGIAREAESSVGGYEVRVTAVKARIRELEVSRNKDDNYLGPIRTALGYLEKNNPKGARKRIDDVEPKMQSEIRFLSGYPSHE